MNVMLKKNAAATHTLCMFFKITNCLIGDW